MAKNAGRALFLVMSIVASFLLIDVCSGVEVGGIHYVFWNFPASYFNSMYVDVRINSEPDNNDGLYFQMYQGTINGEGFYFGLQTQTYKPGVGSMGKGLIFSRWGTTDLSNARVVEGGWMESGGYEGDFIGVRRTYNWTTHDYRFRIALNDSDASGDWYAVWINDLTTGTSDLLGALRFPKTSPENSGIANGGITWTELYWKAVPGTPLPYWHVSILGIYASDQEMSPTECTLTYSSWTNNSDIYCDEEQTIHFLMGSNITRLHPSSSLLLNGSDTIPPTFLNLQQTPSGYKIPSNQPITVMVEAADNQSGIKRVVLSHRTSNDEMKWSNWIDIAMDKIGVNTWKGTIPAYKWQTYIQYKITAYDKANNPSSTNLLSVEVVDNQPPVTVCDYNGEWHNADFILMLSATDNESGVAETYYTINNGPVKAVSVDGQPLITTEGANNALQYWSVDKVGNEELPHKILTGIKLDKTSPLIWNVKRQPEDDVLPKQTVMILTNITDLLSGIKDVVLSYSINSDPVWINITMVLNTTTGVYEGIILGQQANTLVKYKIVAYDYAGNCMVDDNGGQYYVYAVVPEFPSPIILALLMAAALFAVVLLKAKTFFRKF
jgi:hypothetical protein